MLSAGEPMQALCRLEEIPDGGSRGLLRQGLDDRVFVVRQGSEVFAWLNDCPHQNRPLEYRQDRFLSGDGSRIVCYAHGAHFDIRSGHCFAGPCEGEHLVRVPIHVKDGVVWLVGDLPDAASGQRI